MVHFCITQGFFFGVSYYVNKEYFLVFPSIQVSVRQDIVFLV